jgi:hypothetical protein
MSRLYNHPAGFAGEATEGFVSHRRKDRTQDRR